MYRDESNSHIEWDGLTEYSDWEVSLQFIKDFPLTNTCMLLPWTLQKIAYYKLLVEGKAHFTMNGAKQETTEYEIEEYKKDYEGWKSVFLIAMKANS
jgi:hypothetical protein